MTVMAYEISGLPLPSVETASLVEQNGGNFDENEEMIGAIAVGSIVVAIVAFIVAASISKQGHSHPDIVRDMHQASHRRKWRRQKKEHE